MIIIPEVSEFIQPLLVVIVLQFIAYQTPILRSVGIDKPKNLTKPVTV